MKKIGVMILSLAILFGLVPQSVLAAERTPFEVELDAYLAEVSTERGFDVTEANLEAYLSDYEIALTDFATADELRANLGEVIKGDLSNLNNLYESYKLDETALIQLLADNGEELADYIYLDELDYALFFYTYDVTIERDPASADTPVMDEAFVTEFLAMMNLTEAELKNFEAYYTALDNYFADPAFEDALTSWTERLLSLATELEDVEEVTKEQASQIATYFNELFDLMKIKPVISFIGDGNETTVSFEELLMMKEFDYTKADIKVVIYGTDGSLLADYLINSELVEYLTGMYGELPETIEEVVNEEYTDQSKPHTLNASAPKTEKGGKLPKTATSDIPSAILGLLMLTAGILMFKKVNNAKNKAA